MCSEIYSYIRARSPSFTHLFTHLALETLGLLLLFQSLAHLGNTRALYVVGQIEWGLLHATLALWMAVAAGWGQGARVLSEAAQHQQRKQQGHATPTAGRASTC